MDANFWRLIRSGYLPGAMNMALDDALLRAVADGSSPPVLRFYRWQPATLTLGYAQSAVEGVDINVCAAAGIDVVRRPTGGRAVFHDREVTYAVIAPVGGLFHFTSLLLHRGPRPPIAGWRHRLIGTRKDRREAVCPIRERTKFGDC